MTPRLALSLTLVLLSGLGACNSRGGTAPVAAVSTTSEAATDFLIEMVDSRRLSEAESALAQTRASTQDLRDYGSQMTRDQAQLLDELTRLAQALHVAVPDAISDTERNTLDTLIDASGAAFDARFIALIGAEHERSLAAFTRASAFERDPAVRAYAERRLPLIQRHADELKALARPLP